MIAKEEGIKDMQLISRKGNFDSGHRVMNEKFKCFNVHGHTYLYELVFEFDSMEDIGYNIDFKEIKRLGCQWIDDILDHGMLLNAEDIAMIEVCLKLGSKYWLMSLNGLGKYCNPSVENIAKEVFLAIEYLFEGHKGLRLNKIIIYETPNCATVCSKESIGNSERHHFIDCKGEELQKYKEEKGICEYDDRK